MSSILERLRRPPEAPARLANIYGHRLALDRLTATIQGYFGYSQLLVTLSDGTRGVIDVGTSFRLRKELMRFLETHEPEDMIGGVLSARWTDPHRHYEWIFRPRTKGGPMKKD